MKITVLSVGKIKEKFYADAIAEYAKRLKKFCSLYEETVTDEKSAETLSFRELEQVKNREGLRLAGRIRPNSYVIALALDGAQLSSEELAKKISTLSVDGVSDITFVIGGSNGLSDEILRASDFKLSFSRMTFPHQLFKVILMEQIYRAFKINAGEAYHK